MLGLVKNINQKYEKSHLIKASHEKSTQLKYTKLTAMEETRAMRASKERERNDLKFK